MTLSLRPAKSADIDTIYDINLKTFRSPLSRKDVGFIMKASYCRVLIAEVDSEICGYCMMNVLFEESEILFIAIVDNMRGQGLGKALLNYSIDVAKSAGAKNMYLDVRINNTVARNMYISSGFKEVRIRKGYYTDTGEDAIVMSKNL